METLKNVLFLEYNQRAHQQNVQRAKHANKSASQGGPHYTSKGQGPPQESIYHDQGIRKNPKPLPPRQYPHQSRLGATF